MRKAAICLAAAAGIAVSLPAFAQDFYIGGRDGGVGIDVGPRDRDYRYRDRDRDYTTGYNRSYERCTTTTVRRDDGSVRRIRRCRD